MQPQLDKKDIAILTLIQNNCKLTAKHIARRINAPITTVFARIKRLERLGIIREYRAILDPVQLNRGTTAFILASVSYRGRNTDPSTSQRDVARDTAKIPEVQEVHVITGDWDLLIKLKADTVDTVGQLVIDKLRTIKGIEKTLTCMVFDTPKETTAIPLPLPTETPKNTITHHRALQEKEKHDDRIH